jgi:hypothetical protein
MALKLLVMIENERERVAAAEDEKLTELSKQEVANVPIRRDGAKDGTYSGRICRTRRARCHFEFKAGFGHGHGEAVGAYRGDLPYHGRLDASEYEAFGGCRRAERSLDPDATNLIRLCRSTIRPCRGHSHTLSKA